MLSAWSNEAETWEPAGTVAWETGPIIRRATNGDRAIVSGHVVLDTPDLLQDVVRPHGPAQVRATIMHEVAHDAELPPWRMPPGRSTPPPPRPLTR